MTLRIMRHLNQRSEMLSGISHDLRTPLTRLKLQLALMKDEDLSKKNVSKRRRFQQKLVQNSVILKKQSFKKASYFKTNSFKKASF